MIEISSIQLAIGLVVFVVAVTAQTGMLFYWGGSLSTLVKEHEKRLNKIEDRLD